MHGLETIAKLNADTFGPAIENFRRQGRTVLVKYEGLHIVSIETFTDPDEALQVMNEKLTEPGVRFALLAPHRPEQTLGDYIANRT